MNKPKLAQRVEYIEKACEGKSVLHLGCTDWPYTSDAIEAGRLLHFRIGELAEELYGFDFDQEGIDLLRAAGVNHLYRADLERLEEVELDKKFDVIVAGEMIEHLNNPGLFLQGIKRFMNSDSRLLITTINAYGAARYFLYALRGRGGTSEPVHPDHVAYYSYSTLRLLIERAGLDVEEFCFYDIGPEHRPYNRKIVNWFNDISVKIAPQLADGVIAVCRLSDGGEE
jgi:SAM-dependent methyltransferase